MTASIPRRWASNATFSGGAHAGENTKVDPGSAIAANGFYPDLGFAAEHVNHQWAAMSAADRRAMQVACLQLRVIPNFSGEAVDDTSQKMAATAVNVTLPASDILLIKSGTLDTFRVFDDQITDRGTVASITSAVRDAASNGTRVVAIGTGGNLATYSDDGGSTWSASVAGLAFANSHLVYSPVYGGFLTAGSSAAVFRTTDPSSVFWTSAASGFSNTHGIAVLSGGTIVVLGESGIQPRFSRSTNNGSSFTGSVSPPDVATAEEPGDLAGCPQVSGNGALAYHVMRCNAGARLRCNVSADGVTWTQTAILEAPAGSSFDSSPRMLSCKMTGLLVIACQLDTGSRALYASMDGTDWIGPSFARPGPAGNTDLALAGGRLFMTRSDTFWGSDGIGLS